MAHRFQSVKIDEVTIENYQDTLPESLASQVEMFFPPSGSFDDECLRRYLKNLKKI